MGDAPFFHTAGIDVPEDVRREVRHLVVGGSEGIVEAGNFHEYENLETLGIREGTREIAREAFRDCRNLRRADLSSSSLRTIGIAAFASCDSLYETNLPEGLRHIGVWAFWRHRFRQITIPSSVRDIGEEAFAGPLEGSVLSKVTLAGGTVLLGRHVFVQCRQLQNITTLSKVIVVEDGVHGKGRAAVVTGGTIAVQQEFARDPIRLILASPYLASMQSEEDAARVKDAINQIAGGRPPGEGPLDFPEPELAQLRRSHEDEWNQIREDSRVRAREAVQLMRRHEDEWNRFHEGARIRIREGADRIRSLFLGLLLAHRRAIASILERALFRGSEGGGVEPAVVEVVLSFLGDVEG